MNLLPLCELWPHITTNYKLHYNPARLFPEVSLSSSRTVLPRFFPIFITHWVIPVLGNPPQTGLESLLCVGVVAA